MAQRKSARSILSGNEEPLYALPGKDGLTTEYYFSDEEADAATGPVAIAKALALAGAWSDLDWDEAEAELDRIRHGATRRLPAQSYRRYASDCAVDTPA